MARQQNSGIGCAGVLALLLVIGVAIAYWYVVLPVVVVLAIIAVAVQSNNKRRAEEAARHRAGPRDPWLNEVAVALAEFGFTEYARNTGSQIGGVPIEGDIRVDSGRFSVIVTLLATAELAHQAEMAVRAKPEVRTLISEGRKMVLTEELVLYVANGLGGAVVDEGRLREVVQIVGPIAISPPRPNAVDLGVRTVPIAPPPLPPPPSPTAARPAASTAAPRGDALDQIKRLAELRDIGAISDEEFEAKKAELLRRL
jgi:hypothetical protein